ncbi:hypothetical protein Sango_1732600 [Sesamum angolense]|uniref:Uncharacterized protein n=1 Tax=Sesamum angolense TaxID=2727404 RepID=A0AAE1WLG9_9LAMI|nr:hypothetical protein Sango_1732600 [Sesamum angolense]
MADESVRFVKKVLSGDDPSEATSRKAGLGPYEYDGSQRWSLRQALCRLLDGSSSVEEGVGGTRKRRVFLLVRRRGNRPIHGGLRFFLPQAFKRLYSEKVEKDDCLGEGLYFEKASGRSKKHIVAEISGFVNVMEEKQLDFVLVPMGMGVLLAYHVWLLFTIVNNPRKTVIGLNAESRHKWVFCLMADPLKNGVLAVQTIRNNIMASTLLATTAITLSSLISVYVSNKSSSPSLALVYGNRTSIMASVKFFTILLCFLVAFLCNVQSIRYYAHVSFLVTVPTFQDRKDVIEYVARNLNRGSFFWSLGLRAFYLSFPLFLWVFGPIPMFICCLTMSLVLYFLDTTTSFTRDLHSQSIKAEMIAEDVESVES